MKRLLTCSGALLVVSEALANVSFGEMALPQHMHIQDLGFAAALGPRLGTRDWSLIVAVLIFVAFNMYLWTLPITQTLLFYITAPLGVGFLVALIWWIGREPK